LKRFDQYFDGYKDKKIVNILGSCGKKSLPMAFLGSQVTIVDFSKQNKKYVLEVAHDLKINIDYILSDYLKYDDSNHRDYFDYAFSEGGILHFFLDLKTFFKKTFQLIKPGGKLILNDFHPFRKVLKEKDIFDSKNNQVLQLQGDYFEGEVHEAPVAHQKYFDASEQRFFPKCQLKYWNFGEIITALASVGFVIESLDEGPRFDIHKHIPGDFTVVAYKPETSRHSGSNPSTGNYFYDL
jgi:2-polyprenyl-3-methyl-5-hydroxy-6-metoxy-1,4-benzoquinol methylase